MTLEGKRCLGCMHELNWDGRCEYCDFTVETYYDHPRNLPMQTCLNEKYVLGKVIGAGGFGITYIGWNRILNTPIAVKEYFPEGLAGRNRIADGELTVYPLDASKKTDYEAGMALFLEEARTMAEFHALEGIVDVFDFFRENGTAYIVMEYIEGTSVNAYIKQYQKMPADVVLQKMEPIFLALQAVHAKRLIHRDISADNLMLSNRGEIKLIDFGAAKTISIRSQVVTAIFKQGFAAPEQYHSKGKQGPWTDVYGLAASLYYMLTGTVPEESVGRLVQDNLPSLTEKTDIDLSKTQKQAIMKALAVTVEKRFHTVEEFYQALYGKEILQTDETFLSPGHGESRQKPLHHTVAEHSANWFSRTKIRREMKRLEQEKERQERAAKTKHRLVILAALMILLGGGMGIARLSNVDGGTRLSGADGKTQQADGAPQIQEAISETVLPTEPPTAAPASSPTDAPLYVPDVQGMKYQKAKKKIQALGLRCTIRWKSSQKVEANRVVKLSPAAGERIETDGTVTIYVSKKQSKATAAPKPTATPHVQNNTSSNENHSAKSKSSWQNTSENDNAAGSLDQLFDE